MGQEIEDVKNRNGWYLRGRRVVECFTMVKLEFWGKDKSRFNAKITTKGSKDLILPKNQEDESFFRSFLGINLAQSFPELSRKIIFQQVP